MEGVSMWDGRCQKGSVRVLVRRCRGVGWEVQSFKMEGVQGVRWEV